MFKTKNACLFGTIWMVFIIDKGRNHSIYIYFLYAFIIQDPYQCKKKKSNDIFQTTEVDHVT